MVFGETEAVTFFWIMLYLLGKDLQAHGPYSVCGPK